MVYYLTMVNPFQTSGPLPPEDMIDRKEESQQMLELVEGHHLFRLVGPRRYGKTTLLNDVLNKAEKIGFATVLVDLQDVMSISDLIVRIERAYSRRLKTTLLDKAENLLRERNIGLSFKGAGFSATLQQNPNVDPESALLSLLSLPEDLYKRENITSFIVFDEVQDLLSLKGADGKIRSVIQHHNHCATYAFAGSAPGAMKQLFENPNSPFMDQALPLKLDPLPKAETAQYIEQKMSNKMSNDILTHAIEPLLSFTRGHPQRTMLAAHYLWEHAAKQLIDNSSVGINIWRQALKGMTEDNESRLHVKWSSLPTNQQRVLLALANSRKGIYSQEVVKSVGLNKNSITKTLSELQNDGEIIKQKDQLLITDPLLEEWLKNRGIFPH